MVVAVRVLRCGLWEVFVILLHLKDVRMRLVIRSSCCIRSGAQRCNPHRFVQGALDRSHGVVLVGSLADFRVKV